MEPRGQLWFELERVCKDFRDYSGLEDRVALRILVSVLGNLLGEQEAALQRATTPGAEKEAAGEPPA